MDSPCCCSSTCHISSNITSVLTSSSAVLFTTLFKDSALKVSHVTLDFFYKWHSWDFTNKVCNFALGFHFHSYICFHAKPGVHESSLRVAFPGYQVLSDILFRLGLIANALTQCSSQTLVTWIDVAIIIIYFGTVWPFWCWCAVKLWYNQPTKPIRTRPIRTRPIRTSPIMTQINQDQTNHSRPITTRPITTRPIIPDQSRPIIPIMTRQIIHRPIISDQSRPDQSFLDRTYRAK